MRISSDDDTTTLHALFPTLVYQSRLPHRQKFLEVLEDEYEASPLQPEVGQRAKHFAGEYHGQIFLHKRAVLRPFFEELARQLKSYLQTLGMKTDRFDVQFLKSWFVLCETTEDSTDALMAHNHSCSDISWVYYVDVPDEGPPVKFHAGRSLATAPFESAFHYDWQNDEKSAIRTCNWWNSETWSIHPQAGDLLIFPGHQLHSVDANHTNQRRLSVAGDIALSLKPEYQNLEFGRTAQEHWLSLPLE